MAIQTQVKEIGHRGASALRQRNNVVDFNASDFSTSVDRVLAQAL